MPEFPLPIKILYLPVIYVYMYVVIVVCQFGKIEIHSIVDVELAKYGALVFLPTAL